MRFNRFTLDKALATVVLVLVALLVLGFFAATAVILLSAAPAEGQPARPAIDCVTWVAIMSAHDQDSFSGFLAPYDPNSVRACATARWGVDYEQHGYLHSSDHQAILRSPCLLGREPTALEVYDSWDNGDSSHTAVYLCEFPAPTGTLEDCLVRRTRSVVRGGNIYAKIRFGEPPLTAADRVQLGACGWSPPAPTPTPTPQPTATPQPAATPAPTAAPPLPTPAPSITPAPSVYEQMPARHRSTYLSAPYWPKPWSLARRKAVAEANAWVKAHKGAWFVLFVPCDGCSSGQLGRALQ